MRSFLLFLSLITGCEASNVWGCIDGWVDFTLDYPKPNETYSSIDVVRGGKTIIQITQNDTWENKERFSVYHDAKNKSLSVGIKPITRDHYGWYKFKFKPDRKSHSNEAVNLIVDPDCNTPLNQTAYRTAQTTIQCRKTEITPDSRFKFFCKENGSICEDILSTKSALRSNGTFTLTETESRFIVSISNVSTQHGVYWCGVESTEGSYRAALRKIRLEVEDGPPIVIICVAALLLLLFVIILILIYKRYSKSKRNAAAEQHVTQDYIYEEIQDRPQKPDSGHSSTTIYSTANFPTNPSASLRYSTIYFRNGSGEAAEVLMTNPSSSACDYSAVKDGEIPTYSNVNQPSPEDPLYSNVNKTQQQ
ncbi:uncharacterized protein LOC117479626 [Trematomus bernacchii]|uniref:uncharacterized protein LOC117479626 n=1 Tax=Trematomus bernacchii TaxID=40690 RepID=UPI00146DAF99|nr:uncharacterized protein LOC117479626 [Trematomus bernacchii]